VKGHIEAGKLVALASLSNERIAGLENVPTMAEAGLPEIMNLASWEFWYGMQAPAGMPNEIINALNEALHDAAEDPATRDRLQKMNLRVLPRTTPEQADRVLRREIEQYGPMVKRVMAKK